MCYVNKHLISITQLTQKRNCNLAITDEVRVCVCGTQRQVTAVRRWTTLSVSTRCTSSTVIHSTLTSAVIKDTCLTTNQASPQWSSSVSTSSGTLASLTASVSYSFSLKAEMLCLAGVFTDPSEQKAPSRFCWEKGAWAYPETAQSFRVPPIFSGTGKATNLKFCKHIHRINRNKSPLKFREK